MRLKSPSQRAPKFAGCCATALFVALLLGATGNGRALAAEPWWEEELSAAQELLESGEAESEFEPNAPLVIAYTNRLIDLLERTRGDVVATETIADEAIFLVAPLRRFNQVRLVDALSVAVQDSVAGHADLAELGLLFEASRIKQLLREAQWAAAVERIDQISARWAENPELADTFEDLDVSALRALRAETIEALHGRGKSPVLRDQQPARMWIAGRSAEMFRCGMGTLMAALTDQLPSSVDIHLGRGDLDSAIAVLLESNWEAALEGEASVDQLTHLLRRRYTGPELQRGFAAAEASIARSDTPSGAIVRLELFGHELRLPTHARSDAGDTTEIVRRADWVAILHAGDLYRALFSPAQARTAESAVR